MIESLFLGHWGRYVSAIAGIFRRDGAAVGPSLLAAMADRMRHRGPDKVSVAVEGPANVGFLYLHLETQHASPRVPFPVVGPEMKYLLVGDVRLDNRDDLIRELKMEPGASDAHIALAGYIEHGETAPKVLAGDYAFAVWDAGRQRLFCARDHAGVKPFYWFATPDLFAFSSDLNGLLALVESPPAIDEEHLAGFLAMQFDSLETTFYRGIRRLPPAHSLCITRDAVQLNRYWELDISKELRLGSDDEYAEAFRAELTRAVRVRLGRDPVGSFLSGGLDSSSISAVAGRLLAETNRPPLHTFSGIFPSLSGRDLRRIDERHYAQAVVSSGRFAPHWIEADRLNPLEGLENVVRSCAQPFIAPNMYLHRAVYEAAREAGVRVLLDGIDGDSTVSHGLEALREWALHGRWVRLLRECRMLSRRSLATHSGKMVLWKYAISPILRNAKLPDPNPSYLNADFVRRTNLLERVRSNMATMARQEKLPARERHRLGMTSPLYPYILELADATAAGSGVEVRYPFFDRRLMEFCLSLPATQKLRDGWTRWVLRRAMEGILPLEVQWRKQKADLSPNFRIRFSAQAQFEVQRCLQNPNGLDAWFDFGGLRRLSDSFFERPNDDIQAFGPLLALLSCYKFLAYENQVDTAK